LKVSGRKQLGHPLEAAAEKDEIDWEKRDHIGVYPQSNLD